MIYPFVLTLIAGLSTMIGALPIFVKFKNENRLITLACSFAAGVMIAISILDLIPASFSYLKLNNNSLFVILLCFIFIVLGIILAFLLDTWVDKVSDGNSLYNVGILSMIVIILHNIPEGIVTYVVSNKNILLGISLCIAIALHNIPEGISIAIPIYYSTKSKFKAIIYTLVSSLSEFLGAIITYLFLSHFINSNILGFILAMTAGIMLAISILKLIPISYKYNHKLCIEGFIVGFIFMVINLQLNSLIS